MGVTLTKDARTPAACVFAVSVKLVAAAGWVTTPGSKMTEVGVMTGGSGLAYTTTVIDMGSEHLVARQTVIVWMYEPLLSGSVFDPVKMPLTIDKLKGRVGVIVIV